MQLTVGKGFDDIQFGLTVSEILGHLGHPDKRYFEQENEHLQYFPLQLELKIETEYDKRLGWISVKNPEAELFGKKLIGSSKDEVMSFLKTQLEDTVEADDYGSFESYLFVNSWLELLFSYDRLESISIGAQFDDNEEPIFQTT